MISLYAHDTLIMQQLMCLTDDGGDRTPWAFEGCAGTVHGPIDLACLHIWVSSDQSLHLGDLL